MDGGKRFVRVEYKYYCLQLLKVGVLALMIMFCRLVKVKGNLCARILMSPSGILKQLIL